MSNIEGLDIVLASASPRRRHLLEDAGLTFRVHAVDADETLSAELAEQPVEAVREIAQRKAKAAVEELITPDYSGTMAVIASDTMVVFRGTIYGKPADADEARLMLRSLSGHGHDVHTAVSFWMVNANPDGEVGLYGRTFVDTTYVYFKELSDTESEEYIASGDPFDKAGAYGIQSGAGVFVDHIEGELDTVIGFPVKRFKIEFPDLFS